MPALPVPLMNMLLQLRHVGERLSTAFQVLSQQPLERGLAPLGHQSVLLQLLPYSGCVYEKVCVEAIEMLLGLQPIRGKVLGNDVQVEGFHARLCVVADPKPVLLLAQHLYGIAGQQLHLLQQSQVFLLQLKWGPLMGLGQ